MNCPRCQAENPPGMRFCGQCAAPLAAVCPSCGAANPAGHKFCGQYESGDAKRGLLAASNSAAHAALLHSRPITAHGARLEEALMRDLRRPLKKFVPHFLKANETGQAETLEVNHEVG